MAAVVRDGLDRKAAAALVRQRAAQVAAEDQAPLVEAVETEIMSLHEGNIARYRLRPAEFYRWRKHWR